MANMRTMLTRSKKYIHKPNKEKVKQIATGYRKEVAKALAIEETAVMILHWIVPPLIGMLAYVGIRLNIPVPTRGERMALEPIPVTVRATPVPSPWTLVPARFGTPTMKKGA